jgi:serine/threonine-protein phosphatase with EF-hands
MLRGGGCLFGPDITDKLLKKNDLELIIRSHECKELGYEWTHSNKILTIFSASNYYTYGSNKGAYIKLSPNNKPVIVQYQIKAKVSLVRQLSLRERINVIEASSIRNLLEKFYGYKTKLINEYKAFDFDNNGTINVNDWCNVTSKINLFLLLGYPLLMTGITSYNYE